MYFHELLGLLGVQPRKHKPREEGLTMVLDKLGPVSEDYLEEVLPYIDVVKIGWTLSSIVSREYLLKRIRLYREHGVKVTPGGTLMELAYARGTVDKLLDKLKELGFDTVEVSNGILNLSRTEKDALIRKARLKGFTVISEVGKKNPLYRLSIEDAAKEALGDLKQGVWKVIVEGREFGRATCIFDEEGNIIWNRVYSLLKFLDKEQVVFEVPLPHQQIELIVNLGPNVNLANVNFHDVLSLETLRLGIRGDTYAYGKDRPLEVSPSARFIYFILRERGPLTVRELQQLTGLSRRTIHVALRELKEHHAVRDYGSRGREKLWGIT